eukprot:Amastigsp_a678363_103.p4 type:complete len:121 gc:universal Amastigsp_a678363_103:723-361(-)
MFAVPHVRPGPLGVFPMAGALTGFSRRSLWTVSKGGPAAHRSTASSSLRCDRNGTAAAHSSNCGVAADPSDAQMQRVQSNLKVWSSTNQPVVGSEVFISVGSHGMAHGRAHCWRLVFSRS